MSTFAEVGVLYIYILLMFLMVALGIVAFKGAGNLLEWILKDKKFDVQKNNKQDEPKWIKIAFISGIMLFLAVFSVGVLKTIGVEEDHNSHHQGGGKSTAIQSNMVLNNPMSPVVNGYNLNPNVQQLQLEINQLTNQINEMEQILNNR